MKKNKIRVIAIYTRRMIINGCWHFHLFFLFSVFSCFTYLPFVNKQRGLQAILVNWQLRFLFACYPFPSSSIIFLSSLYLYFHLNFSLSYLSTSLPFLPFSLFYSPSSLSLRFSKAPFPCLKG